MATSLQEIQSHQYRRNIPAITVSETGPGPQISFLYTIPMEDIQETAQAIKSLISQATESSTILASVGNRLYLPNGQVLSNVHDELTCAGRGCSLHHPSDNHMSGWSQFFRKDRNFVERICQHGIRHPDLDDVAVHLALKDGFDWTHACCGCCRIPSVKKAA